MLLDPSKEASPTTICNTSTKDSHVSLHPNAKVHLPSVTCLGSESREGSGDKEEEEEDETQSEQVNKSRSRKKVMMAVMMAEKETIPVCPLSDSGYTNSKLVNTSSGPAGCAEDETSVATPTTSLTSRYPPASTHSLPISCSGPSLALASADNQPDPASNHVKQSDDWTQGTSVHSALGSADTVFDLRKGQMRLSCLIASNINSDIAASYHQYQSHELDDLMSGSSDRLMDFEKLIHQQAEMTAHTEDLSRQLGQSERERLEAKRLCTSHQDK
ncbi:unnamed protein product [Protopolystoma xenopodis]|uniref:Uncharacterized protein n=1 Tax=Protopolystoma xenopodis TaxID=117903 RepID=A0A448WB30_9PLAT|nr:unnamed protein product [Protopolystoma xenopodis]